jgi:hypothetical protein
MKSTTSAARPVSSIYSQPSPRMLQHQHPQHPKLDIPPRSSAYHHDISPPDSPRTVDGARSSSPNISPITDAGSAHRIQSGSRSYSSSIPLPKQSSSGGEKAFISSWREKIAAAQAQVKDGKMKWDDYSGEPTGSEKGKSSTSVPGATPFDRSNLGLTTTITSIPQPKPSLFGVSLKKPSRKESTPPPPPPPPPREEWKGASGRSPILPQVQSNPNPAGTKQHFPTPSQRRNKGGFRQAMGLKATGRTSPGQPPIKSPQSGKRLPQNVIEIQESFDTSGFDTSDVETPRQEYMQTPFSIPPRGDSIGAYDNVSERDIPLPSIETIPEVVEPAKLVPRKSVGAPITKKPVPISKSPEPEPAPTVPMQDFSEERLKSAFEQFGLENEPASRFSATTYNTTIPEEEPKVAEEPSLPPVPAESILNRKRPVPAAGSLGPRNKNQSRKSTMSELDNKSLPQEPPEEEIVDRVTLLEAKLAGLNKRKQDIQNTLHELTNVVQPSTIAYDNMIKKEVKKSVDSLNAESASIVKEIHETGLKLHRALKKREESGMYEPTGLWVRRVTG